MVLAIVAVLTLLAKNMARGSTGRGWMAVRDKDIAAKVMGLSLLRTKLQAFAISSFYCGVGGALFAFAYLQTVEPSAFNIDLSFRILFMVIIGGLGTIMGSFLGAGFILLMPIFLNVFCPRRCSAGGGRDRHVGARTGHLRRADHRVLDLRAAGPRAALAHRPRNGCGYGRSSTR